MTLIKIFIGIVKLIFLRPKIEQAEKRFYKQDQIYMNYWKQF